MYVDFEHKNINKCTFQDILKDKKGEVKAVLTINLADDNETVGVHVDYDRFARMSETEQRQIMVAQRDLDGTDRTILKLDSHGRILGVRFGTDQLSPINILDLPVSKRRLALTSMLIEFDKSLQLSFPV